MGYNGGRQPETGSAPGVGRLNWNGTGEGVNNASIWTSGCPAASAITGVGPDPPVMLEQAERIINKNKLAGVFIKFIVIIWDKSLKAFRNL